MANLANINGASLVPNLSQSLGILRQGFGTPQSRAAAKRAGELGDQQVEAGKLKLDAINNAFRDIDGQGGLQGFGQDESGGSDLVPEQSRAPRADTRKQTRALERLAIVAPQAAQALQNIRQSGNAEDREAFRFQAEKGLRQAKVISSQPTFAGKQRAIQSIAAEAARNGEPLERLSALLNMGEPQLDLELRRMEIAGRDIKTLSGGATGAFSKGNEGIVRKPDGSLVRTVTRLNKGTGQIETVEIPIEGELVSTLGENPGDTSIRKVGDARGVAEARRDVELETAAPIAQQEGRGRAEEARLQATIDEGRSAADNIPILNRSIELLNSVETGGFDRAALAAKQFFGVESADEAELSSNLGKTVLSQLRSTFGAAFTEKEGSRLARIEAGFGKSVAGNKRLLLQTKRIMERVANRAIKRAERTGDIDTADEIRESMSFTLEDGSTPAAGAVLNFDAQGNLVQ